MVLLVSLFGVLIALVGGLGVVSPDRLLRAVTGWEPRSRYYTAVGLRLVMGVVLLAAAPTCQFPLAVQIIGWLALLGALVVLLMGAEALGDFMRRFAELPPPVIRAWCTMGGALGGFLIYAAL